MERILNTLYSFKLAALCEVFVKCCLVGTVMVDCFSKALMN